MNLAQLENYQAESIKQALSTSPESVNWQSTRSPRALRQAFFSLISAQSWIPKNVRSALENGFLIQSAAQLRWRNICPFIFKRTQSGALLLATPIPTRRSESLPHWGEFPWLLRAWIQSSRKWSVRGGQEWWQIVKSLH